MKSIFDFESTIILINTSDVISLHDDIINKFGGRPGLRDRGLLESAVHHPLNIIEYGKRKEKELNFLAASYFFHIIKNHAFNDGNKRTGLLTTLMFLQRNGRILDIDGELLYDMALETAKSSMSVEQIALFFKHNSKK